MKACRTFVMDADGAVSLVKEGSGANKQDSKLPEIMERLKVPNYNPAEVMRLLAGEMFRVFQDTRSSRNDSELEISSREMRQLQTLLSLVLREARRIGDRDTLNFEGPKFKYAMARILKAIEKAARDAWGKDCELVEKMMKNLQDNIEAEMPDIQSQVEGMDLQGRTGASGSGNVGK